MPLWVVMSVAGVVSFFYGGDVYLWLLSGHLQNDRMGLATAMAKAILPWVRYGAGFGFLYLAYLTYQRRKYRLMALFGDSPDCPSCGGLMRKRRSRWGGRYWLCEDCGSKEGY